MDSSGRIHDLAALAAEHGVPVEALESLQRGLEPPLSERLAKLQGELGRLVPIPAAELDEVRAMSKVERVAWYRRHLAPEAKRARKAERKRQRAARKTNRGQR